MTINIPYDDNTNICAHRLPCGICKILRTECPKQGVYIKPVTISTETSGSVTYADHTKVKLDKE